MHSLKCQNVPVGSGVVPGAGRMWGCLLEVINLGRSWSIKSVQWLSDIIVWLRDLMEASDVNPGGMEQKKVILLLFAVAVCSVAISYPGD